MIKILDNDLNRLGVIKNVITANQTESINGEYTLYFKAILDSKINTFINENSIFEVDNNFFDVALYTKDANEDGTFTIEIEAEHISYRLNNQEYDCEMFTEIGSPIYILDKILEGTDFTIGSLDFPSDEITYSAQESKSRRQLLMEFIAYLNGEAIFNKFEIGIIQHRGSPDIKPVLKDRNVTVISKTVDKRTLDELGNPTISYTCQPVYLPTDEYNLGDDILLLQNDLGISEKLRIVSISINPYDPIENKLELSNYINGLESSLYRIETQSVIKDALMNGIRIGPEYGFEAIRNDKKARAYFRSDGIAMQSGDGSGEQWKDRLYYRYNSDSDEIELIYDGKLSADLLEVLSGIVTPFIYSENGVIANAVVRRLRTDLVKPWRYLNGDTADVHYQDIGDTEQFSGRYFRVDYAKPSEPAIQFTISALDGTSGEIDLWWFEGKPGTSMTTNPNYAKEDGSDYPVPVMVYQYETKTLHSSRLHRPNTGASWYVRDRWGNGIDSTGRGAGIIEKTEEHMTIKLDPGYGEEIGGIRISVDKGVELYNLKKGEWEYPQGGEAEEGRFETLIATALTARNMYATNGVIQSLVSVRHTFDMRKINNYLNEEKDVDVTFVDIQRDQVYLKIAFWLNDTPVQYENNSGVKAWWLNNNIGGRITFRETETSNEPVMTYTYLEKTVAKYGMHTFHYDSYSETQPALHFYRTYETDNDYGYIYMSGNGGLRLAYKKEEGSTNYIDIGEDGIKCSPPINSDNKNIVTFDRLPTQSEINALPDDTLVLIYDKNNPYKPT